MLVWPVLVSVVPDLSPATVLLLPGTTVCPVAPGVVLLVAAGEVQPPNIVSETRITKRKFELIMVLVIGWQKVGTALTMLLQLTLLHKTRPAAMLLGEAGKTPAPPVATLRLQHQPRSDSWII